MDFATGYFVIKIKKNKFWQLTFYLCIVDYAIEIKFKELVKELEQKFGEGLDAQSILFLIGVHELGQGYQKFSKKQKTELMHVAVCTVLEPYGFYEFVGKDDDKWPHFELKKELPPLDERQQQHLIKEAILNYFKEEGVYNYTDKKDNN